MSTPTTQQQSSYVVTPNVLPLVVDLVVGVKNLIFDDALEILAAGTGGDTYKPITSEGLQQAIADIGEDLHSQYLLTYAPNNLNSSGIFHEIRVQVPYDGATVRAALRGLDAFDGVRPVGVATVDGGDDLFKSEPETEAYLKAFPYLLVDTKLFPESFTFVFQIGAVYRKADFKSSIKTSSTDARPYTCFDAIGPP